MATETDKDGQTDERGSDHADKKQQPKLRPEGPHAKPEHTNDEATPGAGTLPDDADPGGATSG